MLLQLIEGGGEAVNPTADVQNLGGIMQPPPDPLGKLN
jgi:hypothetical protein